MSSPASEEQVCGIVELLKVKGDALAVNVVISAHEIIVDYDRYDNLNGGLYNVSVILNVDCQTYGQLETAEIERLKAAIGATAEPILNLSENESFAGVIIRPRGALSAGWREEAAAWVRGDGVNNQGRVRSDNIASREHDGLLFRSPAEINLYKALKAKGLTFAPLPVFIRGGPSYRRLEPDFLVIKDGYMFQVEVDGDTFHRESPVAAQSRTAPMEFEGVQVRRFSASELCSEAEAKVAVDRLLIWMDKQQKNR